MNWFIILISLAVSFVFSGIEAGILSVNRVRLAHQAKKQRSAARKLSKMLANPHRLLVTVLIVTNLARIVALVLLAQELVRRFGWHGYWMALAVYLPVSLVCLEFLPKSLFRRFPYRALALFAEPLRLANFILSPLHFIGEWVSKFAVRKRPPAQQRLFLAREDFKYITSEGERSGAITKTEKEMIHNVVDFRRVLARDLMTPIDGRRTISAEAHVDDLKKISVEKNQDRWLVVDSNQKITGMVSAFETLLEGRRDVSVDVFQRRHVSVEMNEPAYRILRKMRATRTTLAVVTGSNNEPEGLVVWEDVIRKLVAEAATHE